MRTIRTIFHQLQFLVLASFVLVQSSCVSYEEIVNFTEGPEFNTTPEDILNQQVLKIQPDDILSITVQTLDINAAAPFNGGIESSSLKAASTTVGDSFKGYLVGANGTIDFPVLGKIEVGGLTIEAAKEVLIKELQRYLKEPPIVNMRIDNFKITILGEVNSPSSYLVDGEKITILEAIGLGGDITNYGDRADILIMREENNQRVFGSINLKDRNIFQSPFFYLKQNDFIYVKARKEKTATITSQANNVIPWVTLAATIAAIVVTATRN